MICARARNGAAFFIGISMAARRPYGSITWIVPPEFDDLESAELDCIEACLAGRPIQAVDTGGASDRRSTIGGGPSGAIGNIGFEKRGRDRGRPRRRRIPRLDG